MLNKNNHIDHTAILICSYDGAEDLWLPLSETYRRYWPDCPFKIYLGTNQKVPDLEPFIPIPIGDEKSWSDNILKCLEKIDEENVLMIFDDIFLCKEINSEIIVKYTKLAFKNNWSCLRLSPLPIFDFPITHDIGKMNTNRLYRTSTVWSIYKKTVLIDLLDVNESAWDFEILGSERSNKYPEFYSINRTVLPYLNGVVKGKWVKSVYSYLKNEGFSVSDKKIKKMSTLETLIFKLIQIRSWLFRVFMPKSKQLYLRKIFH